MCPGVTFLCPRGVWYDSQCSVENPMVIFNALSVGYRHLDLAESYNNQQHVRQGLSFAFAPLSEGGLLGIERQDVWLTMKIPVKSIDYINALLAAVGTDYFDLLLYHFPGSMCDFEAELKASWGQMTDQPKSAVRRIGVSNFYAPHSMDTSFRCLRTIRL